jgi:hypothetical protein
MAFLNLSSPDKKARAGQIGTSLGASGNALFYTGTPPASPDMTASGTLLATLPLSATAGIAYTVVQSATVAAGGTGGTSGTQTVTGTSGTAGGGGALFTASVTISGGAITAVLSVTPGQYSTSPSNVNAEPVTGAGLTGATLALVLTGSFVFSTITAGTAGATGTAGYCRMATSGGAGVIDLDVGLASPGTAAMIISSVSVVTGGSVSITSSSFVEA